MKVDWISVKDSLPPYGEAVMFCGKEQQLYIGCRERTDSDGEHWEEWNAIHDPNEIENVTFWCELPDDPPQELPTAAPESAPTTA